MVTGSGESLATLRIDESGSRRKVDKGIIAIYRGSHVVEGLNEMTDTDSEIGDTASGVATHLRIRDAA